LEAPAGYKSVQTRALTIGLMEAVTSKSGNISLFRHQHLQIAESEAVQRSEV
jgi:hypothetical protein